MLQDTDMNGGPETSGVPARTGDGPAIELKALSVAFEKPDGGSQHVLRNLDLEVPRGQFVALVGRSGGGKTTILNVLTGLVEPTSGRVSVLGLNPANARAGIGFVPARDALLPWRNAQRNVEYGLELRGVPRAERKRVASRYLALVGLADAGKLWPWQLSQGMRQRVALVRAWAVEPDLLLMDEPFAALDADTRQSVRAKFRTLLESGPRRTVLLVTHDLDEAVLMADRVIVLSRGRVAADTFVPPRLGDDATTDEFTGEHLALLRTLRNALRDEG